MKRKYDVQGRALLAEICVGHGYDMGCGDKKIVENCLGIDMDRNVSPDIIGDMDIIGVDSSKPGQDFIVASHSLEHVRNVNNMLNVWYRMLRDGGKVGVLVPHGEYAHPSTLGDASGTHHYLFTPKTLEIYLQHAGFKRVETTVIDRPTAYNQVPSIVAIGEK